MLVVLATMSYWCPSCNSLVSLSYRLIPRVVTKLHHVTPRNRQCKCGDWAKLVSMECKTIPNYFGNERNGYWRCQDIKHDKLYYPRPLQMAVLGGEFNSWSADLWQPYRTIAKGGYPWKCPICGVPMLYKDERETKGTCQKQLNWIAG